MKSNHVLWTVFSVVDYDALEFDVTYDGASDTYSLMAHFHRNDIEDDLPNEDADDLSKDLTDLSFTAPEETVDDDIDHDSMEILSNGHTIFLNTSADSIEEMSAKVTQIIDSGIFDGINILAMGVIFNSEGEQIGQVNWQELSINQFGPDLDDDDDDDDDDGPEEFDLASGQVKGIILEDHISDNPLHAKPVKTLQ